MKTRSTILLFILCLLPAATHSAPVRRLDLNDRVSNVIRKYYPKARIIIKNGKLAAKHGTMKFSVHRRWKTGEIRKKAVTVEGPNFKGFLITISIQDGEYSGAAIVPQTLRRPYWLTYIDRPPTPDGKKHYVIDFSYGARLDPKFIKAIFKELPKSVMPTKE